MTDYPRRSAPARIRSRFVRVMDSRAMTRVVQVVAFLSLLLSFGIAAKQYQLASCLATYNNAQARANGPRIQAAEDDRKAQDGLFDQLSDPHATPVQRKQAFEDYVAKRRIANATRAKNPPPPPPSEVCR